jgi:hypothetical protein
VEIEPIEQCFLRSNQGKFYLQVPRDNCWPWSLLDGKREYEGGFGADRNLKRVAEEEVPEEVRRRLERLE